MIYYAFKLLETQQDKIAMKLYLYIVENSKNEKEITEANFALGFYE